MSNMRPLMLDPRVSSTRPQIPSTVVKRQPIKVGCRLVTRVTTVSICTINEDVLGIIFSHLPISSLCAFGVSCRQNSRALCKVLDKYKYSLSNGITLRPLQGLLESEFFKIDAGDFTVGVTVPNVMTFRAPMDFGKTYGGLACCRYERALIVATSNTINVWIEHAVKLNWYNVDPALSRVLIYNASRPKHRAYINSPTGLAACTSDDNWIIITSDKSALDAHRLMKKMPCSIDRVLVMDEAHLPRANLLPSLQAEFSQVYKRVLLLSADKIKVDLDLVARAVRVRDLSSPPIVNWQFIHNTIPVRDIVMSHTRTMIIDKQENIEILTTRRVLCEATKVYVLKKGVGTVTSFNTYPLKQGQHIALLVNTNQNEGINVHASALYFPSSHKMNVTRAIQTVGRVTRRANPHSQVAVYMTYSDNAELHRCYYIRCHFDSSIWPFDHILLPSNDYLAKCVSIMRLFGLEPDTVYPLDGCILFADYSTLENDIETIVRHWAQNSGGYSVLDEDAIRRLMST
jgi:hypothetical protein